MNIFGNINCPHCGLETRFLYEEPVEQEESTTASHELVMLGDTWGGADLHKGTVSCDYCQELITLHAVSVEGVLSSFLNQVEFSSYETGETTVSKAGASLGMDIERNRELKQFHTSFTSDFALHPLAEGTRVTAEEMTWEIERIHFKENSERDTIKRSLSVIRDEYCYEVIGENGERKWLVVTDTELNNALLMQEAPALKDYEQLHDVTDTLFRSEKVYENTLSENFYAEGYGYLTGVRLFVRNAEGDIELDIFEDTIDAALAQVEEVFAVED